MKAAVLHEINAPLVIEDVPIDKPGPREVLIQTAAVGLCHSDLHFMNGSFSWPLPFIPGHEAAGVVEAVGSDVTRLKPGDHVITCLSVFCGHCAECLEGRMVLCTSPELRRPKGSLPRLGPLTNGPVHQFLNLSAFAEQMLVHEHACVSVREEMPLDRAALIGCAVITGVGAVTRTAAVRPGETLAVIGCGGVGLSAINGAAIAGAGRIIAIDRLPAKLELARTFGATDLIDAAAADPVEAVLELTKGGVHHAIEAIGLKATVEQAFKMIRRGGVATVIGMVPPGVMVELPGRELLQEKRLQGSFMGSNHFPIDMPRLVDFYLRGHLHLDKLISRRLDLGAINDGFLELKSGRAARSVVVFDGGSR